MHSDRFAEFEHNRRQFDRKFKWMQRIVFSVFAFAILMIVVMYSGMAYFAITEGPQGLGRAIGQVANGYNQVLNH
jgi:hypothetical protein